MGRENVSLPSPLTINMTIVYKECIDKPVPLGYIRLAPPWGYLLLEQHFCIANVSQDRVSFVTIIN